MGREQSLVAVRAGARDVPDREAAPGAWLRLAALGAAAVTTLVVVSGALHLGIPHRALGVLAVPPLAAVVLAATSAHRRLLRISVAALFLLGVGSAFGIVVGLSGHAGWASALHLAFAALTLAAVWLTTAASFRGEHVPAGAWRDYVTLTKPRIMILLLITAAAGMFVGAQGVPNLWKLAVVLAGGALACAGASALNHYLDRDIDGLMGERTASRPIVAGRLTAPRALEFGLVLSAFSFVLLASLTNVLAAALALIGNLFYVLVYTRWLKRSTVQNIVIGGAAGAVPPLVGWAAATGNLTLPAAFLFLIIFFWTPPHFWALAMLIKREYAAAEIPMLPVISGDAATSRRILAYSLVLTAATTLPFLWHTVGLSYLGAALVLDSVFVVLALGLARHPSAARAVRVFHFSLLYLALLFASMALSVAIA
ncbi:MAG TPA: heme o synthase [Solirubrobacterales bacterium]|nr:heme o synthase [Solirubrobacterales bacterium]